LVPAQAEGEIRVVCKRAQRKIPLEILRAKPHEEIKTRKTNTKKRGEVEKKGGDDE